MKKQLLKPENVCLQVVDMQQSLMAKIVEGDKVAETAALMIRCAEILNIPLLANTQYKKGLGPYLPEIETLLDGVEQYDKVEFNGLANEKTEAFVDALPKEVTTIVLVGVETHICIYQTAMGLLAKDLDVWVVTDGVSSRKREDHLVGIARLESMGVSLGSAEMLIYELLGKAGSPQFKAILPFIIDRDSQGIS